MTDYNFVMRVLNLFAMFPNDINDMLMWRTDGEYTPITFLVDCSDTFHLATADAETITPKNIDALEAALTEMRAIYPDRMYLGIYLFVARQRKELPHAWMLDSYPEARHLFEEISND